MKPNWPKTKLPVSTDTQSDLYIGLMSGTSLDGLDAVLVDFSQATPKTLYRDHQPLPAPLKQQILQLTQPGDNEIEQLGRLDIEFSQFQAQAVNRLIEQAGFGAEQISAIGSHGQTLRHRPSIDTPFTLQIGDPNVLAEQTGICTVADFRRRDIAAGGEGAPLVPAFHDQLFRSSQVDRVILNLGGIANITVLPLDTDQPVQGYDTGPANVLLDSWIQRHHNQACDRNGDWARSGNCNQALLECLLQQPYFSLAPPKSTGRELFHLGWLEQQLDSFGQQLSAADVQATLTELTARTVSEAILRHRFATLEIYICGGGVHNGYLRERMARLLPDFALLSTEALGVDPDWVEATAFAWLAMRTLNQLPGNLSSVTGASGERILGGIYLP